MVTLESDQSQMIDRLNGYVKTLKKKRQRQILLKAAYSLSEEKNVDNIRNFLLAHPTIDAIFFATNYLAVAGLKAIKSLKRSIPKDIGVISFDDNTLFTVYSPSITAVAQPVQKISHMIINELMLRLTEAESSHKHETIVLPAELIIRDSSRIVNKSKALKDITGKRNSIS